MTAAESSPQSVEQLRDRVAHPVRRLLVAYCLPHWPYFAASVLSMAVAQVLWLYPPVVLGVAFDAVFLGSAPYRLPGLPAAWVPSSATGQFWLSAGVIAACYVAAALVYALGSLARLLAAYRVQHALRTDTYRATQALGVGGIERYATADLLSVVNNDVNTLESFLTGTLQRGANAAFIALGVSAYMLVLHPGLALVAFIAPLATLAVNVGYARVVEPRHERRRAEVADINERVADALRGFPVVAACRRRAHESARVREASAAYRDISWSLSRARVAFGQVTNLLPNAGYVLLFVVGGSWVLHGPPPGASGSLAAGTLLSFLVYNGRYSWPLSQVTGVVDSYEEARAAAGRVLGVQAADPAVPEADDVDSLPDPDGRVALDGVTVSYPGADAPALRNVSLTVEAGETVGVVGPTGAGKSTLAKLLVRFRDPDEGAVTLDGRDLRALRLDSLREAVGYVPQDTHIFDATVRENVAYAAPDADDAAVRETAELAGAHEFVADLSDGYDTPVGEDGATLSGGQRQRLALARAVLDGPPVLVFDEALSHVDAETAAAVRDRLAPSLAERTTVVVAHRLAAVRDADRILVVEDGRVVESGTHEALLEADGRYAALWRAQVGTSVADAA